MGHKSPINNEDIDSPCKYIYMCVCVCVCVCVCMCVYCLSVCLSIYIYMCVYLSLSLYIYIYIYIYVCVCLCLCACVCMYIKKFILSHQFLIILSIIISHYLANISKDECTSLFMKNMNCRI